MKCICRGVGQVGSRPQSCRWLTECRSWAKAFFPRGLSQALGPQKPREASSSPVWCFIAPSLNLLCLSFYHPAGGFLKEAAAPGLGCTGGCRGKVILFTPVCQLQREGSLDSKDGRNPHGWEHTAHPLRSATTQLLSSVWTSPSPPVTSVSVHIPHSYLVHPHDLRLWVRGLFQNRGRRVRP